MPVLYCVHETRQRADNRPELRFKVQFRKEEAWGLCLMLRSSNHLAHTLTKIK